MRGYFFLVGGLSKIRRRVVHLFMAFADRLTIVPERRTSYADHHKTFCSDNAAKRNYACLTALLAADPGLGELVRCLN
jgi:hypothetical protein